MNENADGSGHVQFSSLLLQSNPENFQESRLHDNCLFGDNDKDVAVDKSHMDQNVDSSFNTTTSNVTNDCANVALNLALEKLGVSPMSLPRGSTFLDITKKLSISLETSFAQVIKVVVIFCDQTFEMTLNCSNISRLNLDHSPRTPSSTMQLVFKVEILDNGTGHILFLKTAVDIKKDTDVPPTRLLMMSLFGKDDKVDDEGDDDVDGEMDEEDDDENEDEKSSKSGSDGGTSDGGTSLGPEDDSDVDPNEWTLLGPATDELLKRL
jgi:hypothetical protein